MTQPQIPDTNRREVRVAAICSIACAVLLTGSVVWAVLGPNLAKILVLVSVSISQAVCLWWRMMWGWVETTPGRIRAVAWGKYAPLVAYLVYLLAYSWIVPPPRPIVAYTGIPMAAAILAAIAARKAFRRPGPRPR